MTAAPKPGGRMRRTVRLFGRVVIPSPAQAVGAAPIGNGYHLIRTLWTQLRLAREARTTLARVTRAIGGGDIVAEARLVGMATGDIANRIKAQRTKTRRLALVAAAVALMAFASWAWTMIAGPPGDGRWLAPLYFLTFSVATGLYAFRNGWINWQLRRGRRGTAMEYLTTDEGFWPS